MAGYRYRRGTALLCVLVLAVSTHAARDLEIKSTLAGMAQTRGASEQAGSARALGAGGAAAPREVTAQPKKVESVDKMPLKEARIVDAVPSGGAARGGGSAPSASGTRARGAGGAVAPREVTAMPKKAGSVMKLMLPQAQVIMRAPGSSTKLIGNVAKLLLPEAQETKPANQPRGGALMLPLGGVPALMNYGPTNGYSAPESVKGPSSEVKISAARVSGLVSPFGTPFPYNATSVVLSTDLVCTSHGKYAPWPIGTCSFAGSLVDRASRRDTLTALALFNGMCELNSNAGSCDLGLKDVATVTAFGRGSVTFAPLPSDSFIQQRPLGTGEIVAVQSDGLFVTGLQKSEQGMGLLSGVLSSITTSLDTLRGPPTGRVGFDWDAGRQAVRPGSVYFKLK